MDKDEIEDYEERLRDSAYLDSDGSTYFWAIDVMDAIRILKEVLRVDE